MQLLGEVEIADRNEPASHGRKLAELDGRAVEARSQAHENIRTADTQTGHNRENPSRAAVDARCNGAATPQ